MFLTSRLNLQLKKNSKISLSDFRISEKYAMFCMYETSSSSDTGTLFFIQQCLEDGSFKIKKLIWITDSIISAFSINQSCDWIVIAYRGGMICILPLGSIMGRPQKKSDFWKSNDATYLLNKVKTGTVITCMKWWTTYKERNMCIIGRSDGDLFIIDLNNGMTLFNEKFSDYIFSIDVLYTANRTLSYCFITTENLTQWKLLLEEIHNSNEITDFEFGFDVLEYSHMHSSSIIHSKSTEKSKSKSTRNPSYLPSKLYQFSQSTYLKSQYYNGKYFLGAYDKSSGKYKLFDCENLESSLYEFQLPVSVVDICVTEDLLYIVVGSSTETQEPISRNSSIFTESQNLKLCILFRQYAHSQIFEKSKSSNRKSNTGDSYITPSQKSVVPKHLFNCLLAEFDIFGLTSSKDVTGIINFPVYFNFVILRKNINEDQYILPRKSSRLSLQPTRKSLFGGYLTKDQIYTKWAVEEIKPITPIFVVTASGISVCYMSQCFEDKCIDHLLSYEMKRAEWVGAGLKLDMNEIYRYTAELLTSDVVALNDYVSKSKKAIIKEYFDLASASMKTIFGCLTKFWNSEECLLYALSQLVNINTMSPSNKIFLSNAIIQFFGHVMSDPFDSLEGSEIKKNKYLEKFKRFVTNNCYFHDLKASKIMYQFGLVEEAFFIAKEKGCVLDLFNHILENNYNTKQFDSFSDPLIKTEFILKDRDFVLRNIGLVDFEIVARNEPKLIKSLAEFICDIFLRDEFSGTNVFSFQTTKHLCLVFNPHGAIIDILFRIYASSNTAEFSLKARKQSEILLTLSPPVSSSIESLNDASKFSETMKICREIGPELLAYCLLVTSKDNQIQEMNDYIYFIQIYGIINSSEHKESVYASQSDQSNDHSKESSSSLVDLIVWSKSFKQKRNILSEFWMKLLKQKLLVLRDELCISISVLDIELFEENNNDLLKENQFSLLKNFDKLGKNNSFSLMETKPNQRCQIKLLGFYKEKANRVLLLPKLIETGKEIIRQVALGKHHVLILTESGSLYGAGTNECGQLGYDIKTVNQTSVNRRNQCLNIINPVLINMELLADETIFSIAAGDYHSGAIVVFTSNTVQRSHIFTWGWGVHGQLGHGDLDNQIYPKRLAYDFNEDDLEEFPIELAMGCYHSVALTNKGSVYTFGNNTYGQLGIPKLQKSLYPVKIQSLPHDVIHVDTKYYNTVCCTSSNEIFVWGIHPNIWQNSSNQNKSVETISIPERIDTDNLLVNKTIDQISCGASSTTIVTESKLVYCFGSNVWGQLGTGSRKECNKLVEVTLSAKIDFVSTDDGITIAMNVSDKSTKLYVWGRCSHVLVQENLKNLMSNTVKPQLLVEYQHVVDNNLLWKNSFGIDAIVNGVSRIVSKQQLMIIFLNFSKYIDRSKFLNIFEKLKEYDIISDFLLINESIIQSLFWRIKSLINRLSSVNLTKVKMNVILDDIEIIFKFYIRLTDCEKYNYLKKSILTMITGFFAKHKVPWKIFENILYPILTTNSFAIATNVVKFSLENVLSSEFFRDLLLGLTDDIIYDSIINDNIAKMELTKKDIERFYELIITGSAEEIYDAADDHKVVFFATCGHASVVGRFREQQLKQLVDKFRKRQMMLSSQMIQRLYNYSSIFPECLDCLSQTLKL